MEATFVLWMLSHLASERPRIPTMALPTPIVRFIPEIQPAWKIEPVFDVQPIRPPMFDILPIEISRAGWEIQPVYW